MVTQSSIQSSRKRKASIAMPESPPKRVTRARAAKVDDTKAAKINVKRNPTTVKASETALLTEIIVKPAPRQAKTKADVNVVPAAEPTVSEPRKTRGRPKKATEPAVTAVIPTQPKSRSRPKAEAVDVAIAPPAAKTRAKRVVSQTEIQVPTKVKEPPSEPKKTTRTRGTVAITVPAPAKAITTRKKVTFEEQREQNKENQPATSKGGKSGAVVGKVTGLKAKPIRRAAPIRTTRGRKATDGTSPQGSKIEPLSPKKVNQVAKSISSSSEDEVVAIKTPSKSMERLANASDADTKAGETMKNLSESTAVASNAILASPARRPPPPMFKDAMKSSPKRWHSASAGSQSPTKISSPGKDSLMESPKRVNFTISRTTQAINLSHSLLNTTLNESPKRINFLADAAQSVSSMSRSPLKTSLLRSPPKRPQSPMKISAFSSSRKSSIAIPVLDADTAAKEVSSFKLPTLTPQKLFTKRESTLAESESAFLEDHQESCVSNQLENSMKDLPETSAKVSPKSFANDSLDEKAAPPFSPTLHRAEETTNGVLSADQIEDVVMGGTTPPDARAIFGISASNLSRYRHAEESDSEDELTSGENTGMTSPRRKQRIATFDFATPAASTPSILSTAVPALIQVETPMFAHSPRETSQGLGSAMTRLAAKVSSWQASSPDKSRIATSASKSHGICTVTKSIRSSQRISDPKQSTLTPEKSTFFEEEMAVRDQEHLTLQFPSAKTETAETAETTMEDSAEISVTVPAQAEPPAHTDDIEPSQESEEYGDENAIPIDPRLLGPNGPSKPISVITPTRVFQSRPREIHTVSKVPLRAPANDSPLYVPRKRSRSVAAPLSELIDLERPSFLHKSKSEIFDADTNADADEVSENQIAVVATPTKEVRFSADIDATLGTPSNNPVSAYGTPFRTTRLGHDAEILRGAVVFVNVYTTEGADASGIFVELLTQMGARCVKQWNWNPRPSTVNPEEMVDDANAPFNSKVGITHVVFKDGGKRTLHKVRESKGLVLCVGVGWVLDCERENQWLNEADYAIDTSTIPRGGHNRRKSMEPRLLSNINGTLVPTKPTSRTASHSIPDISPTKEFLTFGTPSTPSPASPVPERSIAATDLLPSDHLSTWASPTTPYFLAQGASLMQQTCPPKQLMQPLFPLSGRIADQPDEAVRRSLLMARRKSLQWAPKVGSPLGRDLR